MNINEIANCANNQKKLSKDATWKEYKQLIETLDNTDLVDGDAYQVLINMYNHFQPPAPAKPKTPAQWIAKAMASKNDVRYYLQYIYVDGNTMVATDGHRIHMHTNNQVLENGFYDKNLMKIDESAKYPDYMRVLPSVRKNNLSTTINKSDLLKREVTTSEKYGEAVNVIADIWVQKKYLSDTLSYFSDYDALELVYASSLDSISISAFNCTAVIMPIRV